MVKVRCRNCGAIGSKICSHGENSRKTYIKHTKNSCGKRIRRPKYKPSDNKNKK